MVISSEISSRLGLSAKYYPSNKQLTAEHAEVDSKKIQPYITALTPHHGASNHVIAVPSL